ncbi:MAG: TonB-dependent receptor, partial [Bacteroidota bacterium]
MIWKTFLSCVLGLLTSSAWAQSTGSIQGQLTGDGGAPISFANIVIEGTQVGARSDDQGRFTLSEVEAGEKILVITSIGYETVRQPVQVGAGETKQMEVVCKLAPLQLEGVTVTAEKRKEELQKVPLAVTAVNAKRIDGLQISNINELGRITPNFRTYDDGGGAFPLISTRGITTIDNTPVVGVYIDDVPLFNTLSFPSYFGDLERIEVLKGPQGTLYGRNSIGGVINIISKKPTNYTRGYVSAGYGNLNQYNFQAGISAPIVKDKLFARLNVGTTARDGYIENTFLENTDLLGREVYTGNLRLTYLPNARW